MAQNNQNRIPPIHQLGQREYFKHNSLGINTIHLFVPNYMFYYYNTYYSFFITSHIPLLYLAITR